MWSQNTHTHTPLYIQIVYLVNREEVPGLGVDGVEVQPGVGEQHGGVVDGVQGLGDARRELGVQAGKQGACKYV